MARSSAHRGTFLGPVDRRFERLFLRALRQKLNQRGGQKGLDTKDHLRAIGAKAEAFWQTDSLSYDDATTRGHHWAACLVRASEELLAAHIRDETERLQVIEYALLKPGAGMIKLLMRLMLVFSADRFRTLTRYTEDRVPPRYGPAFAFTVLAAEPDCYVQGVTRCFYNDYFRSVGCAHLTRLFCAFDRLWIDQIDPRRDEVRFERPTTLAQGDDCCRFAFHRAPLREPAGERRGRAARHVLCLRELKTGTDRPAKAPERFPDSPPPRGWIPGIKCVRLYVLTICHFRVGCYKPW